MSTDYEMWITCNAEAEKLRIPVLPEQVTVSIGSSNSSVDVVGLGEIVIKQARPAYQFSFSSFFPKNAFYGVDESILSDPQDCIEQLENWLDGEKPVHLIITGAGIDSYCTIESLSRYEKGGDIGTIYFDMTLKEYREVTLRSVEVDTETETATVDTTETRVDNTTTPTTYTVTSGDCLWNIAKSIYGDGSYYTKIYEANKDIIGSNPNLIYAGQVLTIPEA